MKKKVFAFIALIAVFALVMAGCGSSKEEPEEKVLGLSQWDLEARAWSSNNGAAVTITAVPNYYVKGQTAAFLVRMEGEEVENVPCEWTGEAYTATADLNAADGLCYYLVLTDPEGDQLEVEVNTPTKPTDDLLVNMAHSLETYCHMAVTESVLNGDMLTIMRGDAQIRLPQITRDGNPAVCAKAELVLSYNESEVERQPISLPEDVSQVEVKGVNFIIPALEDDEQLMLSLEVTLTDGQVLSAPACTWIYNDGKLVLAIG